MSTVKCTWGGSAAECGRDAEALVVNLYGPGFTEGLNRNPRCGLHVVRQVAFRLTDPDPNAGIAVLPLPVDEAETLDADGSHAVSCQCGQCAEGSDG